MTTITPSEHEKSEWSRMARAAYAADYNSVGHRYSGAAALHINQPMSLATFDALQEAYRSWLVWGDFKAADYMVNPHLYPNAA